MSADERTGSDAGTETDVEMDVQVVGYPDDTFDSGNWRPLANALGIQPEAAGDDFDWGERETVTSETPVLVFKTGDRVEMSSASEAQKVASRAEHIRFVTDTETDTKRKYRRYQAARRFRVAFMREMPDEVGGGLTKATNEYQHDGDSVCTVNTSLDRYERVLAHRDHRDTENPYETAGKRPAVRVNFDIGPLPESEATAVKDAVLQPAMRIIGRWDAIQKVRVKACSVTKTGDCFV